MVKIECIWEAVNTKVKKEKKILLLSVKFVS